MKTDKLVEFGVLICDYVILALATTEKLASKFFYNFFF